MKTLSPSFPLKLAVLLLACSIGRLPAQVDGELQNGDFVGTWRMRDLPDEQLIPKSWFASQPETAGNPWVKVLDEEKTGVEIKAGDEERYLYQDVRIDSGQTWTLRWKCRGSGSATVSVLPRDDDGNFFPSTAQICPLSDDSEDHEMTLAIPAEARIIRIILAPEAPSAVVVFEKVELGSS